MLICSKLQTEENTDICYFPYFPEGQGGVFLFFFFLLFLLFCRRELGDSGEEWQKDRRQGCDGDGHPLKVNRGVRTLFPPEVEAFAWQPVVPPSL